MKMYLVQSLALTGGASLTSVTAAALRAGAPVSLTLVAVKDVKVTCQFSVELVV